ncbi:MAG: hydroxymethylglutaryl-CoA lyase [Rhodobacteraceae bacterium]|nr:hydroxymethylglutaryl-CoA lyase [Paracoccaceae bacterium]
MNVNEVYPPDRVALREVGLRDGLQLVGSWPGTAAKGEWVRREGAAGVRWFETGSFLPAGTFPQFADVRQVVDAVRDAGAHGIGLVLNERGAEAAIASGVPELACVVSATETHSRANVRRSVAESIAVAAHACALRDAAPHRPLVSATIGMSLGCSMTGTVAAADVLSIAERLFHAGVDLVTLADTVGYAGPAEVGALVRAVRPIAGSRPLAVHLHDTRGLGLANAAAALDAGIRILDASLGGLGGCPFAPGATGNIVMEDLAFLCEKQGFATGIDLEALCATRAILADEMPNERLHGGLARSGLPLGFSGAG